MSESHNSTSKPAKPRHGKSESLTPRTLYGRRGALVATFLVIVIGAVATVMFLLPRGERVNANGFQVVYMTSGQAYFGKLKNTSGEYLTLDTPYTAQEVKVDADGKKENESTSTTLVKVSQQQYGPTDVMSLKSDQVLFWQNLRDDSKVTEAIKNAK